MSEADVDHGFAKRIRLPDRRQSDTVTIEFREKKVIISVGFFDKKQQLAGHPAEVFIYLKKMASDYGDAARDIAVLISVALQHGTPAKALQEAVCRLDNGEAAGLAGAILDYLCGGPPEAVPPQWPPAPDSTAL
jgi:hypothetical protein